MTQPSISITDDLLSAYIDGEVSPVERERVERALARSETLRAELRALRQASRAVAELPRVALPADFSAGVLRAIEQRSLAPAPRRERRRCGRDTGKNSRLLPQWPPVWRSRCISAVSPRKLHNS